MPIITVASAKGGVGKTVSAINLGAAMRERGFEPTLIDLDPAGHLSWGLGIEPSGELGVDILSGFRGLTSAVVTADGLPLVPASPALGRFEGSDVAVLIRQLQKLGAHALLIIDTPPGFTSTLAKAGIGAANLIIIPTQAEPFAANSVPPVLDVARALAVSPIALNYLPIATMVDDRRQLTHAVLADLRKQNLAVAASIPRTVAVPESAYKGVSVLRYAPRSRAAEEYRKVARAAVKRLGLSR